MHEGGLETTSVVVGADLTQEYTGLAVVRNLLDSPLSEPGFQPLVAQVIEGRGAVATGVELIDGDLCLVVLREEVVNKAPTRYSVWLDLARQFVLRRAKVEVLSPDAKHWFPFNLWTVQKLDTKKMPGNDKSQSIFWYPVEATLQMHNSRGEETFGQRVLITSLEFNTPMSASLFTPTIPQGANVRDARTGIVSIHGSGPSPQLKKLIRERTRQARDTLREMEGRGDPGVLDPPTSWTTYGSWFTFVCGAVGLVLALLLRRRG